MEDVRNFQDPPAKSLDQMARTLFKAEQYTELCEEAELLPLVFYLRGCKGLRVFQGVGRAPSGEDLDANEVHLEHRLLLLAGKIDFLVDSCKC